MSAGAADERRPPRRVLPGGRGPPRPRVGDRLPAPSAAQAPPVGHPPPEPASSAAACWSARSSRSRRCSGSPAPRRCAAWPLVVLVALLPANDIAVNTVNQLVTAFLPPRILPRARSRRAACRPSCAPPSWSRRCSAASRRCEEALEHLEVQYLANREAHVHFALLSDFTDAPTETRPGDDAILAAAVAGVEELNRKYDAGGIGPFALFHRPRRWNPGEGRVDGLGAQARQARGVQRLPGQRPAGGVLDRRRRRRGAPRYPLRHHPRLRYRPSARCGAAAHRHAGPPAQPRRVRPAARPGGARATASSSRGSASRCRARTARASPRCTRAIPAWIPTPPPCATSTRTCSARGASPARGSTTSPHSAGDPRPLPGEHAPLARPDRGELRPRRPGHRHRRLRRLPGALPQLHPAQAPLDPGRLAASALAPGAGAGTRRPRAQPALAALALEDPRQPAPQPVEPAWLLFFLAGWLVLPGDPLRWTLLGLGAMAATPWSSPCCWRCSGRRWTSPAAPSTRRSGGDAATSMQQLALAIAFLPHQAWISVDAIVRTLWRLVVSRRQLLEWRTASQTEHMVSGAATAPGARCGPPSRSASARSPSRPSGG